MVTAQNVGTWIQVPTFCVMDGSGLHRTGAERSGGESNGKAWRCTDGTESI